MTELSKLVPATRPVYGAERDASSLLATTVQDVVGNAALDPTGDGATWRYTSEHITVWDSPDSPPRQLRTRADIEGETYHIVDGNHAVLGPVEIVDGKLVGGEHVAEFRRLRAGIYAGTIAGSHEVTAAKQYAEDDTPNGTATLLATVTATSEGDGAVSEVNVDLRFLRHPPYPESPYDDITVIQSHRVTLNPAADRVEAGSVINTETWLGGASALDSARTTRMNEAIIAMDTAGMQRIYQPQTPLDVNPATETWQQLVTQPLSPNEILRAPAE